MHTYTICSHLAAPAGGMRRSCTLWAELLSSGEECCLPRIEQSHGTIEHSYVFNMATMYQHDTNNSVNNPCTKCTTLRMCTHTSRLHLYIRRILGVRIRSDASCASHDLWTDRRHVCVTKRDGCLRTSHTLACITEVWQIAFLKRDGSETTPHQPRTRTARLAASR